MFGCPLERPFSDCCEEMAAPFSNDTLDDLLGSLEESTTELAFTKTEPEDDVCPEGFSHNAEMNVCDDLNEVSEKLFLYTASHKKFPTSAYLSKEKWEFCMGHSVKGDHFLF